MKTFRFAFGQMNNPWLGKHFFPTVFATEMKKFRTYWNTTNQKKKRSKMCIYCSAFIIFSCNVKNFYSEVSNVII